MEKKILYLSPECDVIELNPENVICGSVQTTYNPMNPEEEWTF